jgi:hypothetical protein
MWDYMREQKHINDMTELSQNNLMRWVPLRPQP